MPITRRITRHNKGTTLREKVALDDLHEVARMDVTSQKLGHGREVGWPMQRMPDDFGLERLKDEHAANVP
jgi:hypothetical protein